MAHRATLSGARVTRAYSDEWYTPPHIPAALGVFDLDPCAGPISRHAKRNLRRPTDGLRARWRGRVWFNPPYSNINVWLARFVAHGNGIALVNMRCDTAWWQCLAGESDGILLLQGRIQFLDGAGGTKNPPVGSSLIAYGEANGRALRGCGLPGVWFKPANRIANSQAERANRQGEARA